MTDHGKYSRMKIIRGEREAAQAHYRYLLSIGMSATDAQNMSGHDPLTEGPGLAAILIALGAVAMAIAVVLYAGEVGAAQSGARTSETTFVACLNGQEIKVDTELFKCIQTTGWPKIGGK